MVPYRPSVEERPSERLLEYLLKQPIEAVVPGREGVVAVRVPRPERFAWHKMLVS